MLKRLPSPLLGVFSLSMVCFNIVFSFTAMLPFIFLKALIPIEGLRHQCSLTLIKLATHWCERNSEILRLTQTTEWDIQGTEGLDLTSSYFVVSNHQTWTDIFALQHVFKGKIPFLKFFIKQELIWVPFLGVAWWAMDMPFMKRYSKEFLEKNPHLRGKDIEITRKSCEKFKKYPVAAINFLEGTRFTKAKHQKKKSPYQYLLPPKAGGAALALSVMGDVISEVLDVTILYTADDPRGMMWKLFDGKIKKVTVRVTRRPLPENCYGKNYLEDQEYRQQIQEWVNHMWSEKDRQFSELKALENQAAKV